MIKVVSLNKITQQIGDIRIDRRTPWGNPFRIGPDGTRTEVIELYRSYIENNLFLVEELKRLEPKRLICWCAPKACHGDVLVELLTL